MTARDDAVGGGTTASAAARTAGDARSTAGTGAVLESIAIQGDGSLPPLVYLHFWPADVAHAAMLAAHLPGRQVISLPRPPVVDGVIPAHMSVWVDHFERCLAELDLDGPIYLAGWSVAFKACVALAERRVAAGKRVDLLVSIDGTIDINAHPRNLPLLLSELRRLSTWPQRRRLITYDIGNNLRHTLRAGIQRTIPHRVRAAMAARRPTSTFWWSADGYLAAVWIGTWRQSFRYRPLAVPALLLETEWSRRRRRDHMLGWSHVLKGPVEVLAVGGDHWSLLDDVHGPALVAALSAQLGVADVAAS